MASSADGFIWSKNGVVFDPVEQGAQPNDHDALGASSRQVVSSSHPSQKGMPAVMFEAPRYLYAIVGLQVPPWYASNAWYSLAES